MYIFYIGKKVKSKGYNEKLYKKCIIGSFFRILIIYFKRKRISPLGKSLREEVGGKLRPILELSF